MRYVPDRSGRFRQRPHYEPAELDMECERIILEFMAQAYGSPRLPVPTDALTKLIERDAADLDLYADLSQEGNDVEGVTVFVRGQKPRVKIARELAEQGWRENRLRTTLTHEYGHVKFHAYLWELEGPSRGLFPELAEKSAPKCKRENIVDAPAADWMEWQAGYISGALLMPITSLKQAVRQFFEERGLYGPLKVNSAEAVDFIGRLAALFGVSQDAARVRLCQRRYLTTAEVTASMFR